MKIELNDTEKELNVLSNSLKQIKATDPEQQYSDLTSHISTLSSQIGAIEKDFSKSEDLVNTKKELKLNELTNVANQKQNELQISFNKVESDIKSRNNFVQHTLYEVIRSLINSEKQFEIDRIQSIKDMKIELNDTEKELNVLSNSLKSYNFV